MKKDNYCDNQDICKLLVTANNQYEKVVEQNRSLQGELKEAREELEYLASFFNKDETAIVNRLLRYNRAINAIKEIANETITVYTHVAQLHPQLKGLDLRSRMQQILTQIERIGENHEGN